MKLIIKEILARKSLIRELVIKDLKIRYSRPVLGFLWAFLYPFFIVLVFYFVFSLILKVKTTEAPFFLYLMAAVFPWSFFHDSLMSSTTSLIDNKNLLKESNFPHYFIPVSIVLANLVNFLPSLLILIVISFIILKGLPIFIIFLPIALFIHLIITTGLSIIFSILYVRWRDIKYVLGIVLLTLFYLIPTIYSLRLIKGALTDPLFKIYIHNPFVGLITVYRVMFLKGFYVAVKQELGFFSLVVSPAIFAIGVFLLGAYLYRKNKGRINDYLSY